LQAITDKKERTNKEEAKSVIAKGKSLQDKRNE